MISDIVMMIGYPLFYIYLVYGLSLETFEANKVARFGFGYNGAVLSSVACFSLYYTLRQRKVPKGILTTGIGLIIYSIFDGLADKPISGVPINVFRMFSGIILMSASFYLVALFDEKKIRKIDYV